MKSKQPTVADLTDPAFEAFRDNGARIASLCWDVLQREVESLALENQPQASLVACIVAMMTGHYLAGLECDLSTRVGTAARIVETALNYASLVDTVIQAADAQSPPGRLN